MYLLEQIIQLPVIEGKFELNFLIDALHLFFLSMRTINYADITFRSTLVKAFYKHIHYFTKCLLQHQCNFVGGFSKDWMNQTSSISCHRCINLLLHQSYLGNEKTAHDFFLAWKKWKSTTRSGEWDEFSITLMRFGQINFNC